MLCIYSQLCDKYTMLFNPIHFLFVTKLFSLRPLPYTLIKKRIPPVTRDWGLIRPIPEMSSIFTLIRNIDEIQLQQISKVQKFNAPRKYYQSYRLHVVGVYSSHIVIQVRKLHLMNSCNAA